MINFFKRNKDLIGVALFSILTIFLFIPISFLVTNYSELDINLPVLSLKLFVAAFIISAVSIAAVGFIPEKIKKIILTVLFFVGLFAYFECIFITSQIGQLNGEPYSISKYTNLIITEIVFAIAIIFTAVMLFKKVKFISWLNKISVLLIIVQTISVSVQAYSVINSNLGEKPENGIYAFKYYDYNFDKYNTYSKNHNIAIVLMDGFGKGIFEELLAKYPEYREIFKDFEFYPNTVSPHAQTSYALHALFTGFEVEDASHNEKYYAVLKEHFSADTALLRQLKKNGYKNYIYPFLPNMMYINPSFIDNITLVKNEVNLSDKFYKKLTKNSIAFYALPVCLKKSAHRYLTSITLDKGTTIPAKHCYNETEFYNEFKDKISTDNEKKVFKFYHLRGLHEPYKLNENYEVTDMSGGETDLVELTTKLYIQMVKNYLDRLKENGIYDKTAIILMSDHGSGRAISPLQSEKETSVNSLLLYKNFNQHQDEIKVIDDIYMGVEDIYDLVLYTAGINEKKFDIADQKAYKNLLEQARDIQKVQLEAYKLKKQKFEHKTTAVEPSKIFTYFNVKRNATMTLTYVKGITNKKKCFVLENQTSQYIADINYKLVEFDDETGEYFLTTININASDVPNGEYNLKLVWSDKGKYYEMPIGKLLLKTNSIELLTPKI